MTANELADKLEGYGVIYVKFEYRKQVAAMLRQQQERIKQLEETQEYLYKTHDADKAEIEALKKQLAIILEANTRSRP